MGLDITSLFWLIEEKDELEGTKLNVQKTLFFHSLLCFLMLVFGYQNKRLAYHSWFGKKLKKIYIHVQGSCQTDKVQNENNNTFLSACVLLCLLMTNWRQWRQGLFVFFFLEHTNMRQCSRKGLSIVQSQSIIFHRDTGGGPRLLCLALFAGCWECRPSSFSPQKTTNVRLASTGGVPLVRNRAETPSSRSYFLPQGIWLKM